MKKLIRIGLISGLVMILGGFGLAATTFVLGADPVRVGDYFAGRLQSIVTDPLYVSVPEVHGHHPEGAEPFAAEIGTDNRMTFEEVQSLEIEAEGGDVTVLVRKGQDVMTVEGTGRPEHIVFRTDDGGHRHGAWPELTVHAGDGEDWLITVPELWMFHSIEAESDYGNILIDGIKAETAEYKAGYGSFTVRQAAGDMLEIESNDGDIDWIADYVPAFMKAESKDGLIWISLPAEAEFWYTASCEDAKIELPDRTLTEDQKSVEGGSAGAGSLLTLKAENGYIRVTVGRQDED